MSEEEINSLKSHVNKKIRTDVGAFAKLHGVIFMERLPKTRSGKILRNVIKNITNGVEYKVPGTIEDLTALDEIKDAVDEFNKNLA